MYIYILFFKGLFLTFLYLFHVNMSKWIKKCKWQKNESPTREFIKLPHYSFFLTCHSIIIITFKWCLIGWSECCWALLPGETSGNNTYFHLRQFWHFVLFCFHDTKIVNNKHSLKQETAVGSRAVAQQQIVLVYSHYQLRTQFILKRCSVCM